MLRRLRLSILSVGWLAACAGSGAGAEERLVMPFACISDNGRFRISPSPRREYPVIGPREQQTIRICISGTPKCRELALHRFAIDCGDVRVPWFRVVAASRAFGQGRTWVDDGRLNVVWKASRSGGAPCAPSPPLGFTLPFFQSAKKQECGGYDSQPHRIALPAGFAPLTEIGARIVSGAGAPRATAPPAASLPGSAPVPPVAVPQETVMAEPVAPVEAGTPGYGEGARQWFTVMAARESFDRQSEAPSAWSGAGVVAAALSALLAAAAAAAYRYRGASARADARMRQMRRSLVLYAGRVAVRIKRRTAGFRVPATAPEGAASVAAFFNRARETVDKLDAAGPLQEVLRGELDGVRQRLDAAIKAEEEGGEAAAKTPAVFRTLVRDLERISRIADGAAMSLVAGQPTAAGTLPKTRAEAYALLGINPDVSDAVLKKVGDALRMSWHPDLARDDADRLAREDRIKQINAALDLIKAERQAAA